jgi:hypothetical protein
MIELIGGRFCPAKLNEMQRVNVRVLREDPAASGNWVAVPEADVRFEPVSPGSMEFTGGRAHDELQTDRNGCAEVNVKLLRGGVWRLRIVCPGHAEGCIDFEVDINVGTAAGTLLYNSAGAPVVVHRRNAPQLPPAAPPLPVVILVD